MARTSSKKKPNTYPTDNNVRSNMPKLPEKAFNTNELGSLGIRATSGLLQLADLPELRWPQAYQLFERIRRTDSEIGLIVRPIFSTWGRRTGLEIVLPDNPTTDDQNFQMYAETMFDEIEGGFETFIDTMVSYTPFHGWAYWNVVWALRDGEEINGWSSAYNDGLPAIRKLSFRHPSTMVGWQWQNNNDTSSKFLGLIQSVNGIRKLVPIEQSLHLKFGDQIVPEGLSPLEAIYRNAKMKGGLEYVFGIGADHAAGFLKIETSRDIQPADRAKAAELAYNALAAAPGNFALFPSGMKGSLEHNTFSAASALLEAIRYYGLLKLQAYQMQVVAMATTADTGARSALSEGGNFATAFFNSMIQGFGSQFDTQIGKKLLRHPVINAKFPNLSKNIKFKFKEIPKDILLSDLADLIPMFAKYHKLTMADWANIRKQTGIFDPAIAFEVDESISEPLPVPEVKPESSDIPAPEANLMALDFSNMSYNLQYLTQDDETNIQNLFVNDPVLLDALNAKRK